MDMPDKIPQEIYIFLDAPEWSDKPHPAKLEYIRKPVAQSLADALEWYLQNDDTNMGDPNNGFYIQGHNNAKAALANYRKGE